MESDRKKGQVGLGEGTVNNFFTEIYDRGPPLRHAQ